MSKLLRIISVLILVGGLAVWLAAGANRGWTKTSQAVTIVDEVTGIEGIEYQEAFLPGIEFLVGTTVTAAVLAGISSLVNRTKLKRPQIP